MPFYEFHDVSHRPLAPGFARSSHSTGHSGEWAGRQSLAASARRAVSSLYWVCYLRFVTRVRVSTRNGTRKIIARSSAPRRGPVPRCALAYGTSSASRFWRRYRWVLWWLLSPRRVLDKGSCKEVSSPVLRLCWWSSSFSYPGVILNRQWDYIKVMWWMAVPEVIGTHRFHQMVKKRRRCHDVDNLKTCLSCD